MTLAGAWPAALEETRRAAERFAQGVLNRRVLGEAAYREGELHRLRGDVAAAEKSYEEAIRRGREPLPGLAFLRLGQGKKVAAAAAVRRALSEADTWTRRASLLPAQVEIELEVGSLERARSAAGELDELARDNASEVLFAMAAQAAGTVEVAEGDAQRALLALRRTLQLWQELEAPYEAARTRVFMSAACRALGDGETGSSRARGGARRIRLARRPTGRRARRCACRAYSRRWAWSNGAGSGSASSRGFWKEQPRGRERARDQRAHSCATRAEHLCQARRLVLYGDECVLPWSTSSCDGVK
jgi:tetratricopeptide (TPR) repeat protein